MRQLPLADQLPYRFYPPTITPFLVWAGQFYLKSALRRAHKVTEIDIAGLEQVAPLLNRGDGVLLTPNHPDHADCFVMFELGQRLRTFFYYMAAYQIFQGKNRWILPRIGVFPVDREGADLTAFKTGVNVLSRGANPLVIFPEGEIYRLAERLTPIREGAVAVAAAAAKKLGEAGKTVWIVPIALKYRFLDQQDPLPSFHALMDRLENRFTWWPQKQKPLVDRLYHYAEGILGLKEYEYLGTHQPGTLRERLTNLGHRILERIELARAGKVRDDTVPVRVKELRRTCLEALSDPKTTPDEATAIRRDLHDVFVAVQIFSYPGDYVRESPTLERIAETLAKFEEDFLDVEMSPPLAPRRAVIRLGQPIDVRARLAAGGKPRLAVSALSSELEAQLQSLLDTIPPGRPVPAHTLAMNSNGT